MQKTLRDQFHPLNPFRHNSKRFVVGMSILFFATHAIPLLFGGWVWGYLDLPKSVSQFRNPALFITALGALGLAVPSWRRELIAEFRRFDYDTAVPLLLFFATLVFFKAAFLDYAALALNAIDFSIYDSAMRSTLDGRFMETVTGVNHFGIHATPVLFLLLPLHAVFNTPLFIVFLHPAALVAGLAMLDLLIRDHGIRGMHRFGILLGYFACTLISKTLHYGFHVEVFYPLFGFALLYSIARRSRLRVFVALALFLSVKEDAPFYAAGIFLACAATRRLPWKTATVGIALSVLTAAFYLKVLIPANAAGGTYTLVGAASGFGASPGQALLAAIRNPTSVIENFIRGGWWAYLLPSLGLLRQSPFFWIAALPFFGIYSLAGSPLMLGLALYYGIPLVPLLFYGWIDGFKRETNRGRASLFLAIALAGIALFGSGYLVFRKADLGEWMAVRRYSHKLVEFGPICAPGILVPQMPYSENVMLLEPSRVEKCIATATTIVLPLGRNPYPLTHEQVDELEARLKSAQWRVFTAGDQRGGATENGFVSYSREAAP